VSLLLLLLRQIAQTVTNKGKGGGDNMIRRKREVAAALGLAVDSSGVMSVMTRGNIDINSAK